MVKYLTFEQPILSNVDSYYDTEYSKNCLTIYAWFVGSVYPMVELAPLDIHEICMWRQSL